MKIPTWRRFIWSPEHNPMWPDTRPDSLALRWAADIARTLLLFGVPAVLFKVAGGDWSQIGAWVHATRTHHHTPVPPGLIVALVSFFALGLAGALSEVYAKIGERRHFIRWYNVRHPEDNPDGPIVDLVKAMLRDDGPMYPKQIMDALAAGGPGRPAVTVSMYGLTYGVLMPYGRTAQWLCPREKGEPFSVPANPHVPAQRELRTGGHLTPGG